jgi:hypothetical protein
MSPVSDFAQTVKQQADIVKVIEGYIRLRKSGAQNYQGLCPFHKEKSPSFSVHAVRQFYHCFGCQASGDVFSFVGKIENVGFPVDLAGIPPDIYLPFAKGEHVEEKVDRVQSWLEGGSLAPSKTGADANLRQEIKYFLNRARAATGLPSTLRDNQDVSRVESP